MQNTKTHIDKSLLSLAFYNKQKLIFQQLRNDEMLKDAMLALHRMQMKACTMIFDLSGLRISFVGRKG